MTLTDRLSPRSQQALLVLGVFVAVTGGWELLVWLTQMPAYILPAPSQIASQLVSMAQQALFWRDFSVTMHEVLLGYAVGIVLALVLGVAIAQLPLLELSFMPYIVAFQTIPSVALAPLFLQWFGYGLASKVVMAALIAFFPILINVIAGLQATGRDEIQMLRAFGGSRLQILLKVRVPNALPYVFAGLELGAVFALVGAIVAEFVGAKAGLGNRILQYNEQFNIAGMFAVLIVLAALGMLMHGLVAFTKHRVLFWVERHDRDA
ncbi:ABC transporter permease [Ideonella sp. A 288]|uniref:ABC transporter permease n=1 Tax=Ideonella sp. A 288 TaxID=1962181 RepID=UPI000B4B364A|nr:ABC transporter permease [Ideonella sp. A 288]